MSPINRQNRKKDIRNAIAAKNQSFHLNDNYALNQTTPFRLYYFNGIQRNNKALRF